MHADAHVPAEAFDAVVFDEFLDQALPVVFGYLVRLGGGDREQLSSAVTSATNDER
jgi:hypothetical protein